MSMMDGPKFRRKRKPLSTPAPASDEDGPILPLDSRDARLAQRAAEADTNAEIARRAAAEAQRQAEEDARRQAEIAAAQEAQRAAEQEAQRQAEARRQAALDAQRAAEALRQAEDEARRAAEAERQRAEAEAFARAEEEARAKARARAAEARRKAEEDARRRAEAEAAEALALREAEEAAERARQVEETRRAEAARQLAEEQAAEVARAAAAARAQEEARRAAEARAEEEARIAEAERLEEEAARIEEARLAEAAAVAGQDSVPARRAPPLQLTDEDRLAEAPTPRPRRVFSQSAPKGTPLALSAANRVQVDRHTTGVWDMIPEMSVDLAHLNRNRIITADRLDPAHTSFDLLRTRLTHALQEHGWKRVAITSPGKDCGKTFTAANLAISFSRQENTRTVLMDLDMRRPSLHRVMGSQSPGALGDVLRGTVAPEAHFMRMGPNTINAGRNIAFALNTVAEPYASELLQDPRCADALTRIEQDFEADVMLFDLPPALFYDDVVALSPLFDGVLLVIGGGLTTEREVKEVERRLGKDKPLLGMVLNKAEGTNVGTYTY